MFREFSSIWEIQAEVNMSSKKQWITTEGPWPNEPLPKEERIIAPNPRRLGTETLK